MNNLPNHVILIHASDRIKKAAQKINKKMHGNEEHFFKLLEINNIEKLNELVIVPKFQLNYMKYQDLAMLEKDLAEWVSEWDKIIDMYKDIELAA